MHGKKLVKIVDHPLLMRDLRSNAVLNTDRVGYNAALARRRHAREAENEMQNMRDEIAELKLLVSKLINTNSHETDTET